MGWSAPAQGNRRLWICFKRIRAFLGITIIVCHIGLSKLRVVHSLYFHLERGCPPEPMTGHGTETLRHPLGAQRGGTWSVTPQASPATEERVH